MTEPTAAAILADPCWLAHRYDRQRDEVHFVWLPRDNRRAVAFLTQPEVAQQARRHALPRRALEGVPFKGAPLHLILHSGLTGSTLLTRALDREGLATALSEPPLLTDILSYRLTGAGDAAARSDQLLGWLARPFEPGEVVIVKAGAVGNRLGSEILSRHADSRALCLHAPLAIFLASNARKGLWGRVWGRRLFATLGSARLTELGFTPAELFEQTDLQIAALAWLAVHRIMGESAAEFPDRVRATDSETLLDRPGEAIGAVAKHFRLQVDAAEIGADPLFARHAKTGEQFDSSQRAEELREATAVHREEIEMVVQWAEKVAQAQGITMTLPCQLLF